MKKISTALITIFLASSMFTTAAQAASLNLTVDNKAIAFQYGTPFIDSGSSLVPLRDLLVSLGVANDDEHIRWNAGEQSVTIVKGDRAVKLSVGSNQIFLNGKLFKQLEVPAKNVDGRVYLPARAVAEALDYFVDYDAETSTILVQTFPFGSAKADNYSIGGEVPAGGGVKADNYSNGSTQLPSHPSLDNLKFALSAYGVNLPLASEQLISKNAESFFGADTDPLSLEKVAKAASPEDIVKRLPSYYSSIVNLTFLQLDSIREYQRDDGTILTGAVGHTGGKLSSLTNTWEDAIYFQIFFVGTTKAIKGDKVTVNGIPVGESTIDLTNARGQAFVQPMIMLAAGNLIRSADEYDIRSARSKKSTGKIVIPELEKQRKEDLDKVGVTLQGSKITVVDTRGANFHIESIQIQEHTYAPSSKLSVPIGGSGLGIDLKNFMNKDGKAFAPAAGQTFFIFIKTTQGEMITRFVEYRK
jgi:hypothetical protein